MTDKRVLVVDDGITMRLFYRDVLERAGFQVEEASNGLEGLERAMLGRFDCILADVNMPRMDGHTMVERMRAEPALESVPVVTISTEAREDDLDRAVRAGSNLYIVKPADPAELATAVRLLTGMQP